MTTVPGAPRVLVVDDDRSLRDALRALLSLDGYLVAVTSDGEEALAAAESFRPDLALLDIGLPGETDGLLLAKKLRAASDMPFIFLTASSTRDDTLQAFDLGADDYVTKPFSGAELRARVRAVLRRCGRLVSSAIEVRDLLIDEQREEARRGGVPIKLTTLEFRLLDRLAREPGTAVSKRRLLAEVWGFDQFSPNLVEVHMSSLRRKLEQHGPRLIFTVRGEGYVLRP